MAACIFISYRRKDAIKDARSVYERLRYELADIGPDAVFMDLEGIDHGVDFVETLERQLASCRVLLALIGPQWSGPPDKLGRPRLHSNNDFVRIELRSALARPGLRVVPVLIDDTEFPVEDDLPEDLHPLLRRHAIDLRFKHFEADMGLLVRSLRKALNAPGAAAVPVPVPMPLPGLAPSPLPPRVHGPVWASAEGRDEHGRWADLSVGTAVQRLRWIEPGEFMMGSPASEPERNDDEGPQHRVRIGHGFWLADSACTQALWLAAMGGKNPARFSLDTNGPVEHVSHDDVSAFLARLKPLVTGGEEPVLPTEAQWEYACRAGTTTPFSFGAQITPEQVNCDGNHPYDGGTKGRYRKRTVPVKTLPPNLWGLHEMHGNVWEWCADGGRRYGKLPLGPVLADPEEPKDPGPQALCAVRGGSWDNGAKGCRSAFRFAFRRGYRGVTLGFRLALRSSA